MHGMKQSSHDKHSFAEMREGMGHGKRVLESFRSDTFDATSAAPPAEKLRERATAGTTRMLGVAEKVLPILTPDQRKLAAEKLRTMANAGAEMPFGH